MVLQQHCNFSTLRQQHAGTCDRHSSIPPWAPKDSWSDSRLWPCFSIAVDSCACLQVCVPKNTVLVVTREKGGFLSVLQSSLSTGSEPDPRLAEVSTC